MTTMIEIIKKHPDACVLILAIGLLVFNFILALVLWS